jgi:hypothetical protein
MQMLDTWRTLEGARLERKCSFSLNLLSPSSNTRQVLLLFPQSTSTIVQAPQVTGNFLLTKQLTGNVQELEAPQG